MFQNHICMSAGLALALPLYRPTGPEQMTRLRPSLLEAVLLRSRGRPPVGSSTHNYMAGRRRSHQPYSPRLFLPPSSSEELALLHHACSKPPAPTPHRTGSVLTQHDRTAWDQPLACGDSTRDAGAKQQLALYRPTGTARHANGAARRCAPCCVG
jgi:hypothetical protein